MTDEERHTFCRIVGTLLVSDLKLFTSEMVYLERLYQRLGVEEGEAREIQSKINVRDDVGALAESLSPESRSELLEVLREAAMVDGELAETEAAIIAAVEDAIG